MRNKAIKFFIPSLLIILSILLCHSLYANSKNDKSNLSNKLQLSIKLEKNLYREFMPFKLNISIKNISKETISYAATTYNDNIKIIVTDTKGNTVPLTKYGEYYYNKPKESIRFFEREIKPNETYGFVETINRLYDMSQFGKYYIKVNAELSNESNEVIAVLKSNTEELIFK